MCVALSSGEAARQTQGQYPNLTLVGDDSEHLANRLELFHLKKAPNGKRAFAPTTILVDRSGTIRYVARPSSIADRLHWSELLDRAKQSL